MKYSFLQSSSDLLGLIQVMIVTFGEMPPVFAKQKESNTPYPTQSNLPVSASIQLFSY